MLHSIRVNVRSKKDKFHPTARINFHNIHTIQHNWKVYEVGEVDNISLYYLRNQFKMVMGIFPEDEEEEEEVEE